MIENHSVDAFLIETAFALPIHKHRKNCECRPRPSLFKDHKVIVSIVVLWDCFTIVMKELVPNRQTM